MIKVVLIARSTLFNAKGGDTVQILETKKNLSGIGITAEVKLTHEVIDYKKYDLLHFFNITRPADILYHLERSGKPFILSPILIDYSEYDKYHRKGIAGLFFRGLPGDAIEYCKTLARWIRGKDKLMSLSYLLQGQRRSIKQILKQTSMLLPNSESEYMRIKNNYGYKGPYRVVPNGIDTSVFQFNETIKKDPHLVICVARIEGIKNQLNLIRALNHTRFKLLIIGASSANQQLYYQQCKKMAAGNVHFIEHLPQQELIKYYQEAKVHVLPSWFETTGLSSLEAAAMGCNVVITNKGDASEYFGDAAFYCDPLSPGSIYAAIEQASMQESNEALRKRIVTNYTWEQAALATQVAYKNVITHDTQDRNTRHKGHT